MNKELLKTDLKKYPLEIMDMTDKDLSAPAMISSKNSKRKYQRIELFDFNCNGSRNENDLIEDDLRHFIRNLRN